MPNLVSLNCTSLQEFGKNQTGVFPISQFLVNHFSSDDIEIKLGSVTKLDKRNRKTLKKFTMTPCQKTITSLSFFQFMVNLEQSGSRIPDAQSVKLTFSLTVTFYLIKTENRTKNSLTQLSQYCFE